MRIFYGSGTKAHNEDFEQLVAQPLARLLKENAADLELFIMGYLTLPNVLKPFHSRITLHEPVWDLRSYWNILREMDISIAVLKPGMVADCKSEIKWLEAAMLGIPSVVSATRTYAEVLPNGETGQLATTHAEWYQTLRRLIHNAPRRVAMGQAARDAALARYSLDAMAAGLRGMLDAVTEAPAAAKTRVLVVNVFYPPQAIGGATRVVADNVRDILDQHSDEFEIQVFTTLEGGAEGYVPLVHARDGVKVTAVPTPLDPEIDNKIWDERMAEYFCTVLDAFAPDIIHFHCIQRITVSVCDAARKRGIPYVVTVHDGWWISDEQFLMDQYGNGLKYDYADPLRQLGAGRDGRQMERMTMKREYLAAAVRVAAVSEPFAEIYRQCGFTNVIAIANGVSRLEVMPRVPSPDGRVRLAHIGGASFHKGYHLLRAALFRGRFTNLHLLVIDHAMGPGEERQALWGTTPVTLRGKFPQGEVGALYAQVDVLLAPSVWPESYGLVTREAALAGCWVVASDRGAIGEDTTPENGFVVNVDDFQDLMTALAKIDADPACFLAAAPAPPNVRYARDQANEVVQLYRFIASSEASADGANSHPRTAETRRHGRQDRA